MDTSACDAVSCSLTGENVSMPQLTCDTCRSRFHCQCVSVSENLVSALSTVRGFFWRCEDCFEKDVCALRFSKILTLMQNLNTTSINASTNPTLLDDNSNNIDEDAMDASDSAPTPLGTPSNKRSRSKTPTLGQVVAPIVKRTKIDFNVPDPEEANSEPVASGSVAPVSQGDNFNLDSFVVRQSERYFHLSQFEPSTESDNIKSYIVSKLKCNPQHITCNKLVSSKRDHRRPLTFVSFKIGTTKKLAKKIVNKDIWPKGIQIKAFEDHSKNGFAPPQHTRDRSRSQHRNQHPTSSQPSTRPLLNQPQQQRVRSVIKRSQTTTQHHPLRRSRQQLAWMETYRD